MWDGSGSSPSPFSQPETQVIRTHALENNFVLSLSYHTTAAYVNFLWNYKAQPAPDDDVIVDLSNQYASSSGYTAIRGYDWYQTRGDTNDFSYGCRGDIDWTIETGNSNINLEWNKNRDAMLDIIDAANIGLTGIVTDATTDEPIAATVWVEQAYWPCFTDPAVGDYHKVIFPGTYTVHFQANGYEEQTHTVEVTDTKQPSTFNVALEPSEDFYAYQVTICKYYAPSGNFGNNPTDGIHALGVPDSYCSSIGTGGELVLDMGEETQLFDLENEVDLRVYEGDGTVDGYTVYVSLNWDGPWTYLGQGSGTTEFDLADAGVTLAQYVKIVDDGDGSPYEQNPGADIDAVQNLAAGNINVPPETPDSPSGPTSGIPGRDYSFNATVPDDPNGDAVYLKWKWGDGELSEWTGPFDSGTIQSNRHAWMEEGTYDIQVKAKDESECESEWSSPTTIAIVQQPALDIELVGNGIGKLKMKISNSGSIDVSNLSWSIVLEGGLIISGRNSEGNVDIPAGEDREIISDPLLGFGLTTITYSITVPEIVTTEKTKQGFLFIFVLFVR